MAHARLKRMNKLEQYLKEKGIRYERIDQDEQVLDAEHPHCILKFDRHQICVPCEGEGREWDAICHKGSYGADYGLLEIMGSIVPKNVDDTVEGWLTAEDVIERIEKASKNCEYWIFTFGQSREIYGDNAGTAVQVFADSYGEAREKMCNKYGNKWAFQYSAEEWNRIKNDPKRYWSMETLADLID